MVENLDHLIKNHGIKMKRIFILYILIIVSGCKSNSYKMDFGKNIDKDLVKIEVFNSAINQTQTVYNSVNFIAHSTNYGENDWSVFYDGKLVLQCREFVFNGNDVADYNFKISKDADSILVEMKVNNEVISK